MFGNRGLKARVSTTTLSDRCLRIGQMSLALLCGNSQKRWLPSTDTSNIMTANYSWRRTDNSSNADRYCREKQELFTKKATENGQMQQKHLPFKIKSRYGKIVYLANKIQSQSQFPSSYFYFAHSAQPYSDSSLPNSIVHHFHGCQVTINDGTGVGVFQQKLEVSFRCCRACEKCD